MSVLGVHFTLSVWRTQGLWEILDPELLPFSFRWLSERVWVGGDTTCSSHPSLRQWSLVGGRSGKGRREIGEAPTSPPRYTPYSDHLTFEGSHLLSLPKKGRGWARPSRRVNRPGAPRGAWELQGPWAEKRD